VRDPVTRLGDILEAIENIERYSNLTEDQFRKDNLTQAWIVRQIQNIGEAVRYLPQEWLAEHPAVPWNDIVGMRDRIVHGYFALRLDVVWDTATKNLPHLKQAVSQLLEFHKTSI